MPDLVIRGGSVVTPDGVIDSDIGVENGTIVSIAPELPGASREIDARRLAVLPGLIDVHVHFNEPGRTEWEGIATGSRALAAGGGTVFFDMPLNSTPCTLDAASFDLKKAALEASSVTDFGLWGGLTPGSVDALDELGARGVVGFKAFLCDSGLPEFARSDDFTLYQGMRIAKRLRLPVAVHAESEELTRGLTDRIRRAGGKTVRDFLDSRPVIAELEAIQRVTLLARETGVALHIVHVSSGGGVALAAEARARGVDVTIETCPHYLFFTEDDLIRIGAAAKCAPPLRPAGEQDGLWSALLNGAIDIVASDHSPSSPELKQSEDFFRVWGGIPGVQSTLNVLLDSGHHRRGLRLPDIARLISRKPADRFALPRKGRIAAGYDADFCLVDLGASSELRADDLLYRHKLSPYVGYPFKGVVAETILRGQTIFRQGESCGGPSGRRVRPVR